MCRKNSRFTRRKNDLEKYENEQYVIEEKILKKEEISNLELEMQMYRDIKIF